MLADVPGTWAPATIRGTLHEDGWGADLGFPGVVPDEAGGEVAGQVFSSAELAAHWTRLDDFEGPGYRRVRVTATLADGSSVEAEVYALRRAPT